VQAVAPLFLHRLFLLGAFLAPHFFIAIPAARFQRSSKLSLPLAALFFTLLRCSRYVAAVMLLR
jgi:hypothetical protein